MMHGLKKLRQHLFLGIFISTHSFGLMNANHSISNETASHHLEREALVRKTYLLGFGVGLGVPLSIGAIAWALSFSIMNPSNLKPFAIGTGTLAGLSALSMIIQGGIADNLDPCDEYSEYNTTLYTTYVNRFGLARHPTFCENAEGKKIDASTSNDARYTPLILSLSTAGGIFTASLFLSIYFCCKL